MDILTNRGVELDHCRHCGGTFLDHGEEEEALGEAASPDVWKESGSTQEKGESEVSCPRHRTTQLTRYTVESGGDQVEVDLCPKCSGIWLDAEEGIKLRNIVIKAGQNAETDLVAPPGRLSYVLQLLSGFPMEVWNPRRRTPLVTLWLIGITFAVFATQLIAHIRGGSSASEHIAHTYGLIPAQVLAGEGLWALVTCMFPHVGIWHIVGNTYFLYTFGDNVEDAIGRRWFLLLYFAAGFAGSALEVAFNAGSTGPSIGASGAVSGLVGAYLVLFPRVKLYQVLFFKRFRIGVVWYLGIWFLLNGVMALTGAEGVAWMAHIGGFISGVLVAIPLRPKSLRQQLAHQSPD